MPNERRDRLQLLLAELADERARVAKLVSQFDHAVRMLEDPDADSLIVYGAAALLESFYTGMERAMTRIVATLGGQPSGPSWHRALLTSMTLDIPELRPAVLTRATAAALDPFLAFRHRFRNLYVFDLEREPMLALLGRGSAAWALFDADFDAFGERIQSWIRALDAGR
jgi:hypothetical protein